MTFRWDQWLKAVAVSGVLTLATSGSVFFVDGIVTRSELIALIGMFLSGCGLYMKDHPVPEWEGEERRRG